MEGLEQQNNPEKISKFQDLRGLDLSEIDLKSVSAEVLTTTEFDTKTKWPGTENLPSGFDPEKLLEECKDPGLGIRELHQEGIDGRGVVVAIIDQTLSSEEGKVMQHVEYSSRIIDYKEFGNSEEEEISMHGPAVASLLVGKDCGVAPGAELVYRATPGNGDFNKNADALLDIVEFNKTAEPNKKVRVVSCSVGYMEENPEPGLDRWIDAIKKATDSGVVVVDVSERVGVDLIGGGTFHNKNVTDDYDLALFLLEGNKDKRVIPGSLMTIVPSDYRTMASCEGENEYMYNGEGAMSWSVPYLAGLFALALQVNPNLKQEKIADLINKTTSINKRGLKVVNPKELIKAVRVTLPS